MQSFNGIMERTKTLGPKRIAVAAAHDSDVLAACSAAVEKNIASFILIGDRQEIESLLTGHELASASYEIVDEKDDRVACQKAVAYVKNGEADIVMKGMVNTADLLKAVLDKEKGLRSNRVLSHVAVFETAQFDRLIFVTDAAMNIAPDLVQKKHIIQNAIDTAKALGLEKPKTALLAALESVNPDMQATLDAASLSKMAERGQITGGLVDGPLALDIAVSMGAASHKKIESSVAGQADILVVPTIEVGNVLYKSLVYFAKANVGAIIAGATAPIILTSRADSSEAKLNSIALAVMDAHHRALHK